MSLRTIQIAWIPSDVKHIVGKEISVKAVDL
jgi:hypothetical protein